MSIWGEAIRAQLHERSMTQLELARLAGISRTTVLHAVRGGHCGTDTLQKIARALSIDVAELFTMPLDPGLRRDRMIAAVLRELSDSVSTAVLQELEQKRKRRLNVCPRREVSTISPAADARTGGCRLLIERRPRARGSRLRARGQ